MTDQRSEQTPAESRGPASDPAQEDENAHDGSSAAHYAGTDDDDDDDDDDIVLEPQPDGRKRDGRSEPPTGYRSATWKPPVPPRAPVPSAARILEVADFHVGLFASRDDVFLDLIGAVAACTYLLEQCSFLAQTALRQSWEREAQSERGWTRPMGDMAEEFGPLLEDVMTDHAQVVLGVWYAMRCAAP